MSEITIISVLKSGDSATIDLNTFLELSSTSVKLKAIPNPHKLGLCALYNQAAQDTDSDIIVFCHDDVSVKTPDWDQVLISVFNQDPSIGSIGISGTVYLDRTGSWSNQGSPTLRGQIIQVEKEGKGSHFCFHQSKDDLDEVVVLDGCFFAVRKSLFEQGLLFDEQNFPGFHFYDIDLTFRIRHDFKMRNMVSNKILLAHRSSGSHDKIWNQNRVKFLEKMSDNLPDTIYPDISFSDTEKKEAELESQAQQLF